MKIATKRGGVRHAGYQAVLMLHRTRALLMRQRTMTVNALRGHLAEFGLIAAQGAKSLSALLERVFGAGGADKHAIPPLARRALAPLVGQLRELQAQIKSIEQNSSGGKERLGSISKMGGRYLRTLLVVSATSVIRYARGKNAAGAQWINTLLARRPARLVSVALANKTARIIWAVLVRGESYRAAALATA
jgi:transposase